MRPITKITIVGVRLGVVVLAFYWVLIFVGTHLPSVAGIAPRVNDKVMHFGAYFLLGALLCYITTSTRLPQRFAMIAGVGLLYAAVDEFTQSFVPGRTSDVKDFFADAAGLFTAIAFYAIARTLFRRGTLPQSRPS